MRGYAVVFSPELLPFKVYAIIFMRQHKRQIGKGGILIKRLLLKCLNDNRHFIGASRNSVDPIVS